MINPNLMGVDRIKKAPATCWRDPGTCLPTCEPGLGPLTLKFDRTTQPFLKFDGDIGLFIF